MLPRMKDVKMPLTYADVDAFEKRQNVTLPRQYREWLLRFNGGRPVPGEFSLPGRDSLEGVAWFFAIHDGEHNNLDTECRYWRITTGRLPSTLIPIAGDGSGSLICVSIGEADLGKVYFWDHEAETEPPTTANLDPVANSFNAFVEMLGEPSRA